ncbi:hypothetical protein D3C71_1410080 [compost metagenome]
MQAECAETHCAVLAVRVLCLQNFNIINVDYVVQHTYLDRYKSFQHTSWNRTCQVNRIQVADYEIARNFGDNNPGLAIFGY